MTIKNAARLALFTAIALISGCGDVPPDWDHCRMADTHQPRTAASESTDDLVVYLDTSASMAGYVSPSGRAAFAVSPDGSTIFSRTLVEIRNVVTMMDPQPRVAVRRVAAQVGDPVYSDLELSAAAASRGIYNGAETNVAGAVKAFGEAPGSTAEDERPARFHILVTDGVQSSAGSNSDVNCAQGSDALCVKKQMLDLIAKGWGGAIIGVRSEFQGSVYSEITRAAVQYASGKDASTYRPFYLYVFSPDRSALERLVESLTQRLSTFAKGDGLRVYELTGSYASGPPAIEVSLGKENDLLAVRAEPPTRDSPPCIDVSVSLDTEVEGKQQFTVSVHSSWGKQMLLAGSKDELPAMLKWDLLPVYPESEEPEARYPSLQIVRQGVANGRSELTLEAGWDPGAGETGWRMYKLSGRLDTSRPVPIWVSSWSTSDDRTAENANRTLNVESSLANLWKSRAVENAPAAEVCVRVGPR